MLSDSSWYYIHLHFSGDNLFSKSGISGANVGQKKTSLERLTDLLNRVSYIVAVILPKLEGVFNIFILEQSYENTRTGRLSKLDLHRVLLLCS